LSTVTSIMGRPMFSGFVADRQPDFDLGHLQAETSAAVVIEQLRGSIQRAMAERNFGAPALLRQIERLKRGRDSSEDVAAALAVLIIGH
jgi:hypothetical protein